MKPKLLWVGDMVATTGFARVSHNLVTRLTDAFDVVVLASNYHGDPHFYPFSIYPATNRFVTAPFGEMRIREIVMREKPDLIFCINDAWILNDLYDKIRDLHQAGNFKFVGYYPVDGDNWFNVLSVTANHWDAVLVYTQFGCEEAKKAGLKNPPIYLPHGLDASVFYPMDKQECREKLNIPKDAFIVFNGNRNQPRKRIDLTIKAFAELATKAPEAILYLHMGTKDLGWDVRQVFAKEMASRGIDPSRRLVLTGNDHRGIQNVSDDYLRMIYNVADVGVNTCEGEGWGLVNFEQAACRVAQVVPNHTSCAEIFCGCGDLIDVEHVITDKDFGRETFCVSYQSLSDILFEHYCSKEYNQAQAENCFYRVTQPCFRWDTIADQLKKVLLNVCSTSDAPVGFGKTQELSFSKKNKKKK
jgi:glycosyltransferase involved in cell wall biosynthesis